MTPGCESGRIWVVPRDELAREVLRELVDFEAALRPPAPDRGRDEEERLLAMPIR